MIKYSVNDDSYEVDKLLIAALDGETVWIHFHGELSALNISHMLQALFTHLLHHEPTFGKVIQEQLDLMIQQYGEEVEP